MSKAHNCKSETVFKTISIFQSLLANYSWKWVFHVFHEAKAKLTREESFKAASNVNPKMIFL